MTITRRAFAAVLACTPLAALAQPASNAAATWPSEKAIRIVVPFPAGGTTDTFARALAPELQRVLGQTVNVENKPGDGGSLGSAEVAKAPADGYTLLVGTVGTHAINAALYPKLPYDPVKDFAPITLVAGVPNVVVMNNLAAEKYGIKSLADLGRVSRANPGKLNMASTGVGTSIHLAGELYKAQTGSFMVHFPFAGLPQAMKELLEGRQDIMFDSLPSSLPYIRAGKLKALAVTSAKRSQALPELGTIAESGVPELKGFEASAWFGLLAPAGTPPEVVERVQRAVSFVLLTPSIKERLMWQGAEIIGGNSADFGKHIQVETQKWAEIVKRSGARVD